MEPLITELLPDKMKYVLLDSGIFVKYLGISQSPLYKLHKDYPLLMTSTRNPRSFKMINHGFIEIRHGVAKINDEKII